MNLWKVHCNRLQVPSTVSVTLRRAESVGAVMSLCPLALQQGMTLAWLRGCGWGAKGLWLLSCLWSRPHVSAAVDSFPQVSIGCLLCWHRTGRGFKKSKSWLCCHNRWPLLVKDGYSNLIPAKKENFFLIIQSVSLYRKQLQQRAVVCFSALFHRWVCAVHVMDNGAFQSAALGAEGGWLDANCNSPRTWLQIWLESLLTNRGGACEWMSSEIAWGTDSISLPLECYAPAWDLYSFPCVAGWNPESSRIFVIAAPALPRCSVHLPSLSPQLCCYIF